MSSGVFSPQIGAIHGAADRMARLFSESLHSDAGFFLLWFCPKSAVLNGFVQLQNHICPVKLMILYVSNS